jgi:hypothetical protein
MNAADGGAGVLVSRGRHGAGVKNYEPRFRRLVGTLQSALSQLALKRSAVCLRCPAAEICHVEGCHVSILAYVAVLSRGMAARRRNGFSAARTSTRADEIRLGIGKREEGEL